MGEVRIWVAGAQSIISAQGKDIAELKAALERSENKYYNMGFNDAENSTEPIMFEARKHGFGEGWLAVMAMGVPEDSHLRNPDQIPYLEPPPTQNPNEVEDEETLRMRELVPAIDSHVELIDLEITSNPSAILTSAQPQLANPNVQPLVILALVKLDQPQGLIALKMFFRFYYHNLLFSLTCLYSPGCGDKTLLCGF